MYKRIVLKLSGEALCENGDRKTSGGFDDSIIDRLTDEMIAASNLGAEVSFVVGGGNFWRGRDTKEGINRTKSDQIGMLATLMNAIYLAETFRMKNKTAVVMTPFVAHNFTELYDVYKADALLKNGEIVIFAGGTGLPFFSTDTITAVRASELKADAVLFAKNVNGMYDKDPNCFADAKKYDIITYAEVIARNLKAIDISAISILTDSKIPSLVFNLDAKGSIISAAQGNLDEISRIGTLINVQ